MNIRSTSAVRRPKLLRALRCLCLIVASATGLFPQSTSFSEKDQVQQITDLELRRAAAVIHRDTSFLDAITSDDSVRIQPSGVIETKSQLLSELKSGALTYSSIDVDQLSVRLFEDTAVVTGRSVFRGQREGKPFAGQSRFSRVWVKRTSGWQEVLFQLTAISQP